MMSQKKKIVGFGELLWDCLPTGRQIGGAPGNFAFHATQCGLDGVMVSAVGNDASGDDILAEADRRGLKYVCARIDHPTGWVEVQLDAAGVPQYIIHEEVAWDYIPFTPRLERLAREADAVCFGSLAQRSRESRATLKRFLNLMKPEALKVFDINLRQNFFTKEVISESLQAASILKLNDEEIGVVAKLLGYEYKDYESACRRIMADYNLTLVILTCGASGSYVFSPEETSYMDTPKVEVADTVGAGDAFTASFIASYMQGKSLKESHQLAVEIAAFVCTQKGAMPILNAENRKKLGLE